MRRIARRQWQHSPRAGGGNRNIQLGDVLPNRSAPRAPALLGPMAELEIPNRLLCALRYFIWVALPFIFFWAAVDKLSEGQSYRALACLGAALLSVVVAVYWSRIIPARFRDEAKEFEYLRTEPSFTWVAFPFTFSFIAIARFFDGGRSGRYEALGFLAMAVLTFVVGVCWSRIIPRRWRYEANQSSSESQHSHSER
jgi:hypothetical protein